MSSDSALKSAGLVEAGRFLLPQFPSHLPTLFLSLCHFGIASFAARPIISK